MAKNDNTFLVDELGRRKGKGALTYADGFRLGFGFAVGGLLVVLLIAGISFGLVSVFHLH